MSKGAINFSNDNEYYTPASLIDWFGRFDYDPATTRERAILCSISNFDTIETDGLKADWTRYKRIWINPPFTIKHLFLQKAWDTYKRTKADIYFLCPIEFLTTKRFHDICKGATIYIPNGRIKFEKEDGTHKSPAFGSVILKLSDKWEVKMIDKEKGIF